MLTALYIFGKALNRATSKYRMAIFVLWCVTLAFLFAFRPLWTPFILAWLVFCIASVSLLLVLTRLKPDTVISAFLFSFGVGYVLYYIASFVVGITFMPFASGNYVSGTMIYHDTPFNLLFYSLVSALQLALSFLVFRIKRFKKGFPFLMKGYTIIISLVSAGIILIFATWVSITATSENAYAVYFFIFGIFIIGTAIYIWTKRGIKIFFRKKFDQRGDGILQQEVDRLTRENQRLLYDNETVRAENHSVSHRLATLERNYINRMEAIQKMVSAEVSDELAVDVETVRKLSLEYNGKINKIKAEIVLTSTDVKAVDDLFTLFGERFAAIGTDFMLKVKGNITYMVKNVIAQDKLETLIGDHLQDALVAVKATSKDSFRNVKATIGKIGEFYEFTVHDSGIPFEVDTLTRLGTERVTTHADDGGSGVGFIKTFETMRETGASLIIRENRSGVFSKSVTIRFNGRNEYIIETHRPGEFPASDRYTVIGHS